MDDQILHNLAVRIANYQTNPNRSGFVELYGTEQLITKYNELANRAWELVFAGLLKDSLFDDISSDLFVASSRYNSELNTICDTLEKAIVAVTGVYKPRHESEECEKCESG
jgi:hypothetical protein